MALIDALARFSAYYTLYTVIMKKNLFQKGGIHNEKQYL
jgi:hypothetical protein